MTEQEDCETTYVFDTSAILECRQRYYPPDVFPSLYQKLEEVIEAGIIIVPDEVKTELSKKDDETLGWLKKNHKMVVELDEPIQQAVINILNDYPKLVESGRRSGGDPFVIALAQVRGAVVVTMEQNIPTEKKIKIPRVCEALGIRCLSVVAFIREMKWAF